MLFHGNCHRELKIMYMLEMLFFHGVVSINLSDNVTFIMTCNRITLTRRHCAIVVLHTCILSQSNPIEAIICLLLVSNNRTCRMWFSSHPVSAGHQAKFLLMTCITSGRLCFFWLLLACVSKTGRQPLEGLYLCFMSPVINSCRHSFKVPFGLWFLFISPSPCVHYT